MQMPKSVLAVAWSLTASAVVMAQQGASIASNRNETRTSGQLIVTSMSLRHEATIPFRFSAYSTSASPQIQWTSFAGAKSYALLVEDPDAHGIKPVLHWLVWNIPADVTSLPENLAAPNPPGMVQGANSKGTLGYLGMHPPVGDPPHHYHFQVFALDERIDLPAGSGRDAVLAAANGHVIAKGELVGLFAQPKTPN